MQKKFNIRKGDTVLVLSGEYKGQQGKILKMETKTDKALVEGINLVSKHTKPGTKNPQGGIVKKEAPIHVSNVKVVTESKKEKKSGVGHKEKVIGTALRLGRSMARVFEDNLKKYDPDEDDIDKQLRREIQAVKNGQNLVM